MQSKIVFAKFYPYTTLNKYQYYAKLRAFYHSSRPQRCRDDSFLPIDSSTTVINFLQSGVIDKMLLNQAAGSWKGSTSYGIYSQKRRMQKKGANDQERKTKE